MNQRIESKKQTKASVFERLEERALLAAAPPVITSYTADNRGQVILNFSQKMDFSTFTKRSVHLLGAGANGLINDFDDTPLPISISLDQAGTRLIITPSGVAPDANYRIKLSGSIIKGSNGVALDGEFHATGNSGDGTPGGDFQFRAKRASVVTTHPLAIIRTNLGDITVQLRQDLAPTTVANFKHFADLGIHGGYDRTIVNRNNAAEFGTTTTGTTTTTTVPPYQFLEAGQFLSSGTQITQRSPQPTLENSGLSNERGTIATATGPISSTNPTSEPSGFIFNVTDNHKLNPNNGSKGISQVGTTVFGNIVSGLSVMVTIFKLPTSTFTPSGGGSGTSTIKAPSIANFDTTTTRVVLGRVAILDRVVAIT